MISPSSERKKMKVYLCCVVDGRCEALEYGVVVLSSSYRSFFRQSCVPTVSHSKFLNAFFISLELSIEFEFILKQNSELQDIYIWLRSLLISKKENESVRGGRALRGVGVRIV